MTEKQIAEIKAFITRAVNYLDGMGLVVTDDELLDDGLDEFSEQFFELENIFDTSKDDESFFESDENPLEEGD